MKELLGFLPTARIMSTLFSSGEKGSASKENRLLYEQTVVEKQEASVNQGEYAWNEVFPVLQSEKVNPLEKSTLLRPYWWNDGCYDLVETFGALVQFIDDHDCSLPVSVLPPVQDIERFKGFWFQRPNSKSLSFCYE